MKLNNFMFKEEYAYTYEEVLDGVWGTSPFTSSELILLLKSYNLVELQQSNVSENPYNYSFVEKGVSADDSISEKAVSVVNKLLLRYGNHYAVITSTQETSEVVKSFKNFMIKLFNVLDYTFEKYDALLSMYAENKSKLLDKLERTRSEEKSGESEVSSESSSGSKSAGSDTPQTINVSQDIGEIAGYFNRYDQAQDEASSSSEGSNSETIEATETFDPTTLMARIDEIQKQYENTMFKWVEEFDRLFIEEGNI